jgi:hypothetical protein
MCPRYNKGNDFVCMVKLLAFAVVFMRSSSGFHLSSYRIGTGIHQSTRRVVSSSKFYYHDSSVFQQYPKNHFDQVFNIMRRIPVCWMKNICRTNNKARNSRLDVTPSLSFASISSSVSLSTDKETSSNLLSYVNQEPQNRQLIDECIDNLEHPYRILQDDFRTSTSTSISSQYNNDTTTPLGWDPETKDSTILDDDRFQSLIGWYYVKYVKTSRPNDNPVGGKWTRKNSPLRKILNLQQTYQHILPTNHTGLGNQLVDLTRINAMLQEPKLLDQSMPNIPVVGEAVNALVFNALWSLLTVFVILRGDAVKLTTEERYKNMIRVPVMKQSKQSKAQPSLAQKQLFVLSPLAIRALFDSPRIIIVSHHKRDKFKKARCWMNINLGPKSAVILDTSYSDDTIRIGVGGRSGTRFVFQKCLSQDEIEQANEYQVLLRKKPWKTRNILLSLFSVISVNAFATWKLTYTPLRLFASTMLFITSIFTCLILFSSGGIEDRALRNKPLATSRMR